MSSSKTIHRVNSLGIKISEILGDKIFVYIFTINLAQIKLWRPLLACPMTKLRNNNDMGISDMGLISNVIFLLK